MAALIHRLTEKDIWNAIEATGVKYQDWTARKEFNGKDVILHIYLEPKPTESLTAEAYTRQLSSELSKVSSEFGGLAEILGCEPLQISFLKPGSFEAYMKQRQRQGADLAHIKPTHMQPSDQVMRRLLEI